MRTTVVVVTYRPGPWLVPAIESAAVQADEVVLVDNGSAGNQTYDAARDTGSKFVRLDRNLGFSAGANAGLAVATGDVLALLNDDAVAAPDWLRESAERLEDPTIAAVAPKLLLMTPFAELRFDDDAWGASGDPRRLGRMLQQVTVAGRDVLAQLLGGVHRLETGLLDGKPSTWRWTSGRDAIYVPLPGRDAEHAIEVNGIETRPTRVTDLINSAGSYLSVEGHVGDFGWETPDGPYFDRPRDCFGACGAAMAFTRTTLKSVGAFPERFFAYYEDADWCWRAQLRGLRVVYEPSAVVRHVRGATSGGQEEFDVRLLSGRNRLHTLARNAPMPVLTRQLRRLRNPDLPDALVEAARRRTIEGLRDRLTLRRTRTLRPKEVWQRWAGVDEQWPDPGLTEPRAVLPPKVEFGD